MKQQIFTLADQVRERALRANIARMECPACGQAASVADPHAIARLLEHARTGHSFVQSITGISYSIVVSPYEITDGLGAE